MSSSTIVTQDELQELVMLDEYRLRAQALRSRIRSRILDGAPVEPGRVKVRIVESTQTHLTQQNLRDVLGPVAAEQLKNALPQIKRFAMYVSETNHSSSTTAVPVFDPATLEDACNPGEALCLSLLDQTDA